MICAALSLRFTRPLRGLHSKANTAPAMTPRRASGRATRKKASTGPAPSVFGHAQATASSVRARHPLLPAVSDAVEIWWRETAASLADVWARSLEGLAELHVQPSQLAWLKLTRPLALVENTALIATPNAFVKEQLETRLRPLVTHALSRELGRPIQLAVTVDPSPGGLPEPPPAPLSSPLSPGAMRRCNWLSPPSTPWLPKRRFDWRT